MSGQKSLKVCVVGAGVSGLVALKELLQEGHRVTCLEKEAEIGGTFASGVAYNDMRLTVSQYFMAYSSLPPPLEQPRYHWTREEYLAYLRAFCDRFALKKHIRCNAPVGAIHRRSDGSFGVEVRQGSKTVTESFDAVAICKGPFRSTSPRMPILAGAETFAGDIVHTATYKDAAAFKGKRVVCIGMGETAADVTKQISEVASQCWLSMRSYPHLLARRPYGQSEPNDVFSARITLWLPHEQMLEAHQRYRRTDQESSDPHRQLIAEWHHKSGQGKFIQKNDEFVGNVLAGKIRVVPHAVQRVQDSTVFFADGTSVEADVIMCCTGYEEGAIPEDWLADFNIPDVRQLFKHAFHPDLGPRFALIGWARPMQGGVPACSEMVSRYFALLCSDKRELPSASEMRRIIREDAMREEAMFHNSPYIRTLVEYVSYMDGMGALVDCLPRLGDYLGEPQLLFRLLCGSALSITYRLRGPHADPDMARRVIMNLPVARLAIMPDMVPAALAGRVDAAVIPAIQDIVARGLDEAWASSGPREAMFE